MGKRLAKYPIYPGMPHGYPRWWRVAFWPWWAVNVALVVPVFFGIHSVMLVLFPSLLCMGVITTRQAFRSWERADELDRRFDDVPYRIVDRARTLYTTDWREAAIECHESHLPGDCPLCGAE